ncbi:MAG: AraC family transcriptional regulator [Arcobacter sp.]|jgi:AraC-like DNA-binding protein|uniref:AraC family transcriptional regulator n=1 Tax=Arcobacter sp. TaxID=1872629 RepID=UPI002A748E23|nr:AraC family transcriptional regulator [Arcobacter sp.]MDY3199825.1 AraC family transcriptional regulator [Arcobacter sp.]
MNKTLYFSHEKLDFLELRYSISNQCYKQHIHNSLSIGAILDGQRIYTNKNKTITLEKNQLAIINPNTIHSCNSSSKIVNKIYMLYLDKNWCFELQKSIFPNINEFIPFSNEILKNKTLYKKFITLCELLFSNALILEKESCVIGFFCSLYTKYNKNIQIELKTSEKIENIILYMKNHLKEDISLNCLSKEFNLSTFYIIKLFKKELNISAHSYFINLKIEFAKELLKKGFSIVETALECGFFDQSHFHRNFKKIVAITPKEYQDNFIQ